ncbi:PEP-CTERM sorting domain-containing protein [Rhodopirellula sallentina]|uniref:Secreted protein containing PEP-CTERM bacterial domain protein n=1 Tax=Rhodopirellula sallentina SM41 TaxID=1263870 RepID=M5TUS0_9BACT|nr:PEP-CTERM sorting domain-containing protein [Rhodopirellula sallentina]EMI52784.1 secreted protein containing PEP-CTERM bacterial domain protein [Rhodopirellula sallentina SM41]
MIRLLLTIPCFILLASTSANAAVILSNDFAGNVPGNVDPYFSGQVADPLISSPGVTRPGHTLNGGYDELVAGELRTFGPNVVAGDRYFGFTINPAANAVVSFDNFNFSGNANANGGRLPDKLAFRSSVDSFNADIGTVSLAGATIDLSAVEFQDVTAPIEFRLYTQVSSDFSNSDGSLPGTTYDLDSFAFNGTVTAVPEPASFAFLTLCAVAVGARRRKVSARNSTS